MDVGVRELKAKLSAYLDRAAAGEMITVTDRGRPVATLGPLMGEVDLAEAVAARWVTPATNRGLKPVRRYTSERTVQQAITEDRSE